MKCPTCQTETAHIRLDVDGTLTCHSCGKFSQTGGSKTDKILTRASNRVTEQQIQHEGDMIPPYTVDKNTKEVIPNEAFMEMYPHQSAETYTKEELANAGFTPPPTENTDKGEGIEFKGDTKQGISDVINEV